MSRLDLLSQLLRELEMDIGTNDMSALVLESLTRSIRCVRVKDFVSFRAQFDTLAELFSNTEPKFGVLRRYFAILGRTLDELGDNTAWKTAAIRRIKDLLKESRQHQRSIIDFADTVRVENKTILIHDHSHTVHSVLAHYMAQGKHFRVIIAEQDFEKTHQNIERLHRMGVPFQVVPAYMLSHVHGAIDMVFFGAVTLKDTMDFVMTPGAHGIISEFHTVGIPVYMFINTLKFSLWKSKPRGDVFMHEHKRMHVSKPIEYDRVKYSHDRVPASLFRRIVTNEGVFTPGQIKKIFQSQYKAERRLR